MQANKFYFSTPVVNPHCPYGLPHPCVAITERVAWDRAQTFELCHDLNMWLRKKGFGELTSGIYQADSPELMTCEAVKSFLETKGMIHNSALDPVLMESLEL
jgi:hypothetical protein